MIDQLHQLNQLATLHQQGVLSDDEFAAAKAKLVRHLITAACVLTAGLLADGSRKRNWCVAVRSGYRRPSSRAFSTASWRTETSSLR